MLHDTESHSMKIARSSSSADSQTETSDSRTLLSRDYVEFRPPSEQAPEPISRSLSREITEHKRQIDSQSYLDRGISFLGDSFSGKSESLKNLETLAAEADKGVPSKDRERAMRDAISRDQSALDTDAEITKYGSGIVETAGLFISGKKGIALTAAAFAAGTAKPADPVSTRAVDMALGVTKGLTTRAVFGAVGKSGMDIPTKALAMGGSSRFTDSLFTRQTYLDPTNGSLDISGAAGRVISSTLKPEAMATDLLVFGVGQGAMSSRMVKQFAEKSALTATVASAATFGFAGGGSEEVSRQIATGQFDLNKIIGRGIARSATDAIAAIPGGIQGNRNAARQTRLAAELDLGRRAANPSLASEPTNLARALDRQALNKTAENQGSKTQDAGGDRLVVAAKEASINFGRIEIARSSIQGSQSREFKIVGGDARGLELLKGSHAASAVVAVREVSPTGAEVGPTRKMLVQHHDADTPINSKLAATCDLIASCNPNTLVGEMRAKHIFPDLSGSVFLSKLSDRLTFGAGEVSAATASGAVPLGRVTTVSDLLRLPTTDNLLRTPRPLELYAREMQHYKEPAKRVIAGGADSIVFELADGRILKMTDRPYRKDGVPVWNSEWGNRSIITPEGVPYRFDARMLTEPKQIEVNHEPIFYYIQERARTPVSTHSLVDFHNKIDRDGQYVFWDGGVSSLGQVQLGYVKGPDGQKQLVLLDYDAVRKPHEVPADYKSSGSGSDHWMSRYRADRVDWDKIYR